MLPHDVLNSRYAFIMFDSPLAAKSFMNKMQQQDIACQYGKETPHLKQKALEDPHSSNLYVAEIPLDALDDVSGVADCKLTARRCALSSLLVSSHLCAS